MASSVVTAQGNKRFFVSLLSLYTGVTVYGCGCNFLRYVAESERITKNLKNLNENQPISLSAGDHLHYPWYLEGIDKWEYKLVKMIGYFREERVFVRRVRNGQEGFLVLAPFVTANKFQDPSLRATGQNYPLEPALIVSLGWVPHENVEDIEMSSEVLPLLVSPFFLLRVPHFIRVFNSLDETRGLNGTHVWAIFWHFDKCPCIFRCSKERFLSLGSQPTISCVQFNHSGLQ
jgi:SURF1 family